MFLANGISFLLGLFCGIWLMKSALEEGQRHQCYCLPPDISPRQQPQAPAPASATEDPDDWWKTGKRPPWEIEE